METISFILERGLQRNFDAFVLDNTVALGLFFIDILNNKSNVICFERLVGGRSLSFIGIMVMKIWTVVRYDNIPAV